MDGSASAERAPIRLFSAGGGEAPAGLGGDLLRILRLPAPALQKLWQVLGPSLAETIAKETEELLDVFCTAYGVDPADLAAALKGCRFLIREAARRDVPPAALGEDLERLCPGDALVKELVLAWYEAARPMLRDEIVRAAIADHGKLLVDVRWRLDAIQSTDRGRKLKVPVALLTLHYVDGKEAGRVTLHVLPDMMAKLKGAADEILGS